ncbi:hypothetical protein G9A89_007216 [Geosiphon pyriformis]|nr:hypothetical protein G9A89_007216 [Geosiphon pyriformis]
MESKLKGKIHLWIANKFDGVWVFTSGLESGHLGVGVVVIMDFYLVRHVSRVSEDKILVSILGLYTGASSVVQFSQAGKINSFIAKTINESSLVILSGDFNEDSSHKCVSFRKYADLGLVNSLTTIDFIFVSPNLINTIVHQEVLEVSKYFNTDYKAVSMSKFNFKNAGEDKWNDFKDVTIANMAMFSNEFAVASRFSDLDTMWDVIRKVMVFLANEIFKKKWFKDNDHIFTKGSSRFHRLELLVSKIVRVSCEDGDLVDSDASFDCVCSALSRAKKFYCALKLAESLKAKEVDIKSAINKRMESFETDKDHTIKTESAFNFYVNKKITDCLEETVDIESARENFYTELFQHTSLPRNYSFTPIIREINQIIKRYTQQQFPITYADKDKGRLQTPALNHSPIHHTIIYQKKAELLETYDDYFERFKLQLPMPSKFQSPPSQPDFRNTSLWEITKSEEEKEEKSEDQEFNYQNLIMENLKFGTLNLQTQKNSNLENSEIETPNIQPLPNQNNQNSDLINQPDLPFVIVINPPPIQQPLVPFQQPPQLNLDPMTYVPIAKLEKFTGKEDNAQKAIAANEWNDAKTMQAIPYFLQDTADSWYQSLVNKLQDFNAFKIEFLRYFSNYNSINRLVNTFTTIKQGENKAVTTYLGHFHRNLHQIQAINANYFTFIHGLCSNFKATKLEANYAQAVNLVMNGLSELDSKLKQFKLHTYNAVATLSTTSISSANLLTNNTDNLSAAVTTHLLAAALELTSKWNPKAEIDSTKLEIINGSLPTDPQFFHTTSRILTTEFGHWNYLSLLVTQEDAQPNNLETNQQPTLTSNISSATIIENKSLDAIFLFKLEEPSTTPLFNGAF